VAPVAIWVVSAAILSLEVSFWAYLQDRITSMGQIPPLADLMRQRAACTNVTTSF